MSDKSSAVSGFVSLVAANEAAGTTPFPVALACLLLLALSFAFGFTGMSGEWSHAGMPSSVHRF